MPIPNAMVDFAFDVLAYGGGGAAVAYLVFQTLGKKWIEARFAERLDQLKHQQALELQRLRVEINSLLGGALKLQEREFDLLPQAWAALDEAYGWTGGLVSRGQVYPGLNQMRMDQLEEFLEKSELTGTQRADVREARDRDTTYQSLIFRHRLFKAKRAISDLRNLLARSGIFFPTELKKSFADVVDKLWDAVIAKEVGHEAEDFKMQGESSDKFDHEVAPLYRQIEQDIQARLASHGRRNSAIGSA